MQCPVCKTSRLSSSDLEPGLAASSCDACGGAWIAQAGYQAWRAKQPGDVPETTPPTELQVAEIPKAKMCPQCGRLLLKFRVGHGVAFDVDHCGACGGIWLDRNEWAALKQHGLHDNLHQVLSSAWQNDVRKKQVQEKLQDVYLARMGKETYAKAQDIRTWLRKQPLKSLIMAILADATEKTP